MAISNWIRQIGRYLPRLSKVTRFPYSINLASGGGNILVFGELSRGSIFTTRVKNECCGDLPSSVTSEQDVEHRKSAIRPTDLLIVLDILW